MFWTLWLGIPIIILIIVVIAKNKDEMKQYHKCFKTAYVSDGLQYKEAEKIAWYLIDMLIYIRLYKDPIIAKKLTLNIVSLFEVRLKKNDLCYDLSKKVITANSEFDAIDIIMNSDIPDEPIMGIDDTIVDKIRDYYIMPNYSPRQAGDTLYDNFVSQDCHNK